MLCYSLSLGDLCVDSGKPVWGDSLSRTLSCTEHTCYTQNAMKQPQIHAYIYLALSGPIHIKNIVKWKVEKLGTKSHIVYVADNQHVCMYVCIHVDVFSVDTLRDV